MGKYKNLQTDVFSVFGSDTWKAENIKTFPSNFNPSNQGNEFIRVTILSGKPGINVYSVSGTFVIDIFTSAGLGPDRSITIADKLDQYLVGNSIQSSLGTITQFLNSTFESRGLDKDNPSLYRSIYTIPFSYFEVR
jgi:hypothetical protein